jgi:dihydroorotate dehydrogenase
MTGLCEIVMNGEKVALRFGMPACRYFMEHVSQDHVAPLSGDSVNETGLSYLLYAGYYNHCIAEDKKPVKKLSDFMEFIELNIDNPEVQKQLAAVGQCFEESKPVQKFIEKTNEATEQIKKKMIGMKLNPSATENSDSAQISTED